MIPGFDFATVISTLGYPSAPVEIADVEGVYTSGQWRYAWSGKESRLINSIALMNQSQHLEIEQQGNFEDADANIILLDNIPMYAPGVLEFKHANGGDYQSFFRLHDRWYRVTGFDFIWSNTNCRSYNGVMYSEFGVEYEAAYQH